MERTKISKPLSSIGQSSSLSSSPSLMLDASFVQVSSSIAVQQQQKLDFERQQQKQKQKQQQQQQRQLNNNVVSTISEHQQQHTQKLQGLQQQQQHADRTMTRPVSVDRTTRNTSTSTIPELMHPKQKQQQLVPQQQQQETDYHTNGTNVETTIVSSSVHQQEDHDDDGGDELQKCIDYLNSYQHSLTNLSTNSSSKPQLSKKAAQRMQQALEADIERLQLECLSYEKAIQTDQSNQRVWNEAVDRIAYYAKSTSSIDNNNNCEDDQNDDTAGYDDDIDVPKNTNGGSISSRINATEAFQLEVSMLEESCRQCEHELTVLHSLKHEQLLLQQELNDEYNNLAQEQNDLYINAKGFDNELEQKYNTLLLLQDEYDRVTSNCIHIPNTIYNVQVDIQRGLRYPLINNLRLAYRPKNDINWDEIQGSWSLAAQLLLSIGTLYNFQSKHCKIVPLSHCAKIIYYPPQSQSQSQQQQEQQDPVKTNKSTSSNTSTHPHPPKQQQQQQQRQQPRSIVYNLGHPNTNAKRALLTWNTLLCQLIHFVHSKMTDGVINGCMINGGGVGTTGSNVAIASAGINPNSSTRTTSTDTGGNYTIPNVPFDITSTTIGSISLIKLDERDDAGWSRAIHYMACNLLWLSDCASIYLLNEVLCR